MTTTSSDTELGTAGQAHQELSSIPISIVFPESDSLSNFGTIEHHENGNPVWQPTNAMHISASPGTSIQHSSFLDSKPSSYAPIDYDAPFDSIPDPIPDNDDDGSGDLADMPPAIGSTIPSIHPPVNPMFTFPLPNGENGNDTLAYTMPSSYLLDDSNTLTMTSHGNPYSTQFGLRNIDNSMLAGTASYPQVGPLPTTASGKNINGIIAPTDMILYQPSHQFKNSSWPTGDQTPWVGTLATPASFTNWDPLPSSAAQPTALLPGGLLHPSAAIPPPLSLPGALQDSRHNELINHSRALSTSKRTSDDQCPRRPEKRACPIRPKLTPAQPGSAAITQETNSGSRQRRATKDKHGGVPADMMHTFQKEGPATSNAFVPRIRSKKVCLRCQTLREKCSGTFPCQNCGPSNVRCTGRTTVYNQLPCFDADPRDLNIFSILAYFHGIFNPNLPLPPNTTTPLDDFWKASLRLSYTALEHLRSKVDSERIFFLFSMFKVTELPAGEMFFESPGDCPDNFQWKPERVLPAPEVIETPIMCHLLLSITQRRALARLAGLARYEVDVLSAALSDALFELTKKLVEKVKRQKASPAEKNNLHSNLLVLLFLSRMRSTYVLRTAEETFVQILYKQHSQSTGTAKRPVVISPTIFAEHSSLIHAVTLLREYTQSWSRRRELLVIWTRHWLQKLYGDQDGEEILSKTGHVLGLCTLLSFMDLEPQLIGQATCERDRFADGRDGADSVPSIHFQFAPLPNGPVYFGEREDTNWKASAVDTLGGTDGPDIANFLGLGLVQSLMMMVRTPSQSSFDEETLNQNLDHLVGGYIIRQMLAQDPQPQLSDQGTVFMPPKKGTILDYQIGGSIDTSDQSMFKHLRDKIQERGFDVSSDVEWNDILIRVLAHRFVDG
ncbi:hypothetical protein QBC42DRAFT_270388 [Cladorrhinum samala]|uniref:Zn(2)-C6 fungal-type domain-containing protein n=1 Tax=Cladorrhinum samala TaxID=585594 RepID=A0AAV9HMH4_9PEZI|nr:hypothetical protein QBC42DRAFT_270388 [Cladorrhinum samala]